MSAYMRLPFCLLIVSVLCGPASSQHRWPQFRGPNSRGVAVGSAPIQFGPKQNLRWVRDVPSGHSSPCIWDDRIFLTAFDPTNQQLFVVGMKRDSGEVAWQTPVDAETIESVHRISSPATATPTTDGQRVYAYFGSVGLLALSAEDGQPQWQVPLPTPKLRFGSGTSPVVAGELVLLNREGRGDAFLLALDRNTGDEVWRQGHSGFLSGRSEGYATPVVHNDVVVMHRCVGVFAYRLSDGKSIWSARADSEAAATPVVTDQHVYVCTWTNAGEPDLRAEAPKFKDLLADYDKDKDRRLSKQEFPSDLAVTKRPELKQGAGGEILYMMFFDQLDLNKDSKLSALEWRVINFLMSRSMSSEHGVFAIRRGGKGNVSKSHLAWKISKAVPEVPSPLLYQGLLYVVKNGGIVTCADPESGQVKYRSRLGAPGGYYASPVAADGRIYFASDSGVVTVIAAGEELKVLSRNPLDERIMATPAIVDDTLYVRTDSKLYAFGEHK